MALNMKPGTKTLGPNYGAHLGQQHVFKPATGMVQTEKKHAKEAVGVQSVAMTETVHPGVLTDGMSISVEGGRTLNLGNYESARIGVTITVPTTKDELAQAYEWATNWISERLDEAVKQVK